MATVEQARDVEVERALMEIRQRLQQIDAHGERAERERVRLWREGWQIFWQGIGAVATALLAGAALGGLITHLLHL